MVDWKRLNVRYSRLSWQQRLGNLASSLARAAAVSESQQSAASVPDLLREGMWIIEWSAADAPVDIAAELAPMQLELGLLSQAWTRDPQAVRTILAFRTRTMSERVLEFSGLLGA